MFYFDKNFGLFVGKLKNNEFHKHYALQISVSIEPNMKLSLKETSEELGDFFLIDSKIDHKLLSKDTQLTILVNPLSPLGHIFQQKYDTYTIDIKKKLKSILSKLLTNKIDFQQFCASIKTVLNQYRCNCEIENHLKDDRIFKVLDFFEENFEKVYHAEEIANSCCLSISRFLHLFKEKTGLTFRRYQLWNKIVKSLPYLEKHSITKTAHAFGFTDSSHYTRTFKETFGVLPKFFTS